MALPWSEDYHGIRTFRTGPLPGAGEFTIFGQKIVGASTKAEFQQWWPLVSEPHTMLTPCGGGANYVSVLLPLSLTLLARSFTVHILPHVCTIFFPPRILTAIFFFLFLLLSEYLVIKIST